MNKEIDELPKTPKLIIIILMAGIAAILIVSVLYFIKFGFGFWSDPEKWGQLGDYFSGILNPIVSFFALCVLVYTVKLQLHELKQSNKALTQSTASIGNQLEMMKLSHINDVFFNLLQVFSDRLREINAGYNANGTALKGREAVQVLYYALLNSYFDKVNRGDYPQLPRFSALINEKEKFFSSYGEELSPYISSFFILVDFIENDIEMDVHRKKYYRILFSTLSECELALMFYFALLDDKSGHYLEIFRANNVYSRLRDEVLSASEDKLNLIKL